MSKYTWDLEKIKIAVEKSINFSEVLQILGIPRQGNNSKTLKSILDKNKIDYSHFTYRARSYKNSYISALDYLNNDKYIHSARLKKKLLKEGIIENKCAKCGISEWNEKPITLQLHHIDGDNSNNNIDNLQLLCPNCHSQTENFCGSANTHKEENHCQICDKVISKLAKFCPKCHSESRRKVVRPSKECLLQDLLELKYYTKIGQKYKVSDVTIKKWIKQYEI